MAIENLEKKLNGELPVTRGELIELVDSWGKVGNLSAYIKTGECYDLSKLDVSQITNFDDIFAYSLFDGDISNWDTSNTTSMCKTFYYAEKFNQPLPWDTSKVTYMNSMFYEARNFNQPLNFNTINLRSARGMLLFASSFAHPINFNVSNLLSDDFMLDGHAFIRKFNNNEDIVNPKKWIEENREKMKILSISENEKNELDSFFDGIEDSLKIIDNTERTSLLTECNK